VDMARRAVEAEARGISRGTVDAPGSFRDKRGVFVTINTYPSRMLRGCIGFPEPRYSLASGIINAASNASRDPRFKPLTAEELSQIVVEVSVLTQPEEIKVAERHLLPRKINLGKDGLMIEFGASSGLLLPQVATEWGWSAEQFLDQLCVKAGLSPGKWMDKSVRIKKFQAEVFAETAPRGRVERRNA